MLIAHLTDPHIGLQACPSYPPFDPETALHNALAHVRQLDPAPEVVLITGDLSDGGRAQDYATLARLLEEGLPAQAEGGPHVLLVPGNHDIPALAHEKLKAYLPRCLDAPDNCYCIHVQHGPLHLIGLDTVVSFEPYGALSPAHLQWLERRLQICAGEPVLIFMHHPPLVTGMSVMDDYGLRSGRKELADLVAAHGQVQLIACGHQHRTILGALGGAPVVVLPSTSHQLNLDLRPEGPLMVRMEPPMIGLYRWTPEDGMACHFSYIHEFDGPFACTPTPPPLSEEE